MKVSKRPKTPAELLAEIKTVHGTGSGLDADQLDGNHAAYFASASALAALAADTYSKSETYTKSEVNAQISSAAAGFATVWEHDGQTTPPTNVAESLTVGMYLVTVENDSADLRQVVCGFNGGVGRSSDWANLSIDFNGVTVNTGYGITKIEKFG